MREAFSRIFKAYDIRGKVDISLDESAAESIGIAFAEQLIAYGETCLVVGRDGRLSSLRLQQAFMRGVASQKVSIIDVGEVTSPMVYFAAETLEGVNSCAVITGSHNPPEDNGIKLVTQGQALYGQQIQALRKRIGSEGFDQTLKQVKNLPGWGNSSAQNLSIFSDYRQRIASEIQLYRPLKVVVDAGNGVAGRYAPEVLRSIGCEVIELFCEVDGHFPNHHPDPAKLENLTDLKTAVFEHQADLGLAFDGDGDRCGVIDNQGLVLEPDRQLILFARDILKNRAGGEIIFDVKCSALVAQEVEKSNGKAVMWKTGHSLMKAKMKVTSALLGGEMSGHLFFQDRWYGFDDAIYTAARLVELLARQSQTAAELFAKIPQWQSTPELHIDVPEGEANLLVENLCQSFMKESDSEIKEIITLDGVRVEYKDGWGLVRASNTTSTLTIRFEATTQQGLEKIQKRFKQRLLVLAPELKLPF
ncbi:phosphomannomutase/phosphoglucomutase [Hydrogenovibrio kuenenii]|uniref:phosphomannomutase/phosphoglucomutase n=1 Tax=Hydrogenovibrio kuenenii TaxID=63658 RepID=UPI000464FCB0|nr:phosphomannomutase/phosphoglucomutase [Hydrogenovibrio kuenenii]